MHKGAMVSDSIALLSFLFVLLGCSQELGGRVARARFRDQTPMLPLSIEPRDEGFCSFVFAQRFLFHLGERKGNF